MIAWEYLETPAADGEAWLAHPDKCPGLVQFKVDGPDGSVQMYRLQVVTTDWVAAQLRELTRWAAWPNFLVVRTGTPAQVREAISHAFEDASLRHWATQVSNATWRRTSGDDATAA